MALGMYTKVFLGLKILCCIGCLNGVGSARSLITQDVACLMPRYEDYSMEWMCTLPGEHEELECTFIASFLVPGTIAVGNCASSSSLGDRKLTQICYNGDWISDRTDFSCTSSQSLLTTLQNPAKLIAEIIHPEVLVPEVKDPDVRLPVVIAPEVLVPEVEDPDVRLPVVIAPEVINSGSKDPDTITKEVSVSNVIISDLLVPNINVPEIHSFALKISSKNVQNIFKDIPTHQESDQLHNACSLPFSKHLSSPKLEWMCLLPDEQQETSCSSKGDNLLSGTIATGKCKSTTGEYKVQRLACESGSWKGQPVNFQCSHSYCPTPPTPHRASGVVLQCDLRTSDYSAVSSDCRQPQRVGTVVTYKCSANFKPIFGLTSHSKICQEGGTWSDENTLFACSVGCGKKDETFKNEIIPKQITPTIHRQWSWHVSLYFGKISGFWNPPRHTFLCGGTLINARSILTTADCVFSMTSKSSIPHDYLKVDIWRTKNSSDLGVWRHAVKYIHIHPSFNSNKASGSSNMAIIELSSPLYFTEPACYLQQNDTKLRGYTPSEGIIVGFDGDMTLMVNIPVLNYQDCLEAANHDPKLSETLRSKDICITTTDIGNIDHQGNGLYFPVKSEDSKTRWYMKGLVTGADISGRFLIVSGIESELDWINSVAWSFISYNTSK